MDHGRTEPKPVVSLLPRGVGHQFVFYGDACSGVQGSENERALAATNAVVQRLSPTPEFVLFAGDEVIGLTTDETELRRQWQHWFDVEMVWLDRATTPLYNTTSNHTTYDRMSERVFADVLAHLPRNGPEDQVGLSYYVRKGDLLLVFINTNWSGLGGEGRVETEWLADVLKREADAVHRFVVGHHPAFPVNGFSGPCQRELCEDDADALWNVFVEYGVDAYLCSHILAFDVQVHRGVLQIVSAGAGTPHRMPAETEYLHAVQMAVDDIGLRYQVLDHEGLVREQLSWPVPLPPAASWDRLETPAKINLAAPTDNPAEAVVAWRITGSTGSGESGSPQTLLAAWPQGSGLNPLWVGMTGLEHRLTIKVAPTPGRSPHYWYGPRLGADAAFDLQIAMHYGMGPGGLLWRTGDAGPWSSLRSASSWGLERLPWLEHWSVGAQDGTTNGDRFRGRDLTVSHTVVTCPL